MSRLHLALLVIALSCVCGCSAGRLREAMALADSPYSWDRSRAVFLLEGCSDMRSLAVLHQLAGDDEPEVRGHAIKALADVRDWTAVDRFVSAIEDDRKWTYCERGPFSYCLRGNRVCDTAHEALCAITQRTVDFAPGDSAETRSAAQVRWRKLLDQDRAGP